MPLLDRLIASLANEPFDALFLLPGRLPLLRRGTEDRPVGKASMVAESILRLVREVAPGEIDLTAETWRFERTIGVERFAIEGRRASQGRRSGCCASIGR